ncbi:MAG TPA: adenylosuccinate lyase [Clostridiaceae bacterium]|nr:adenylosuccinate lyase [Clostridiaceae bacterium]
MKTKYENPLCSRYSSEKMQYIFSPDFKFSTWRRLWIALAESEKELGLPITDEQIAEMKAHVSDIDYDTASKYEKILRHDVMAHVHAFGEVCPKAKPIIHLGATSCYVGDNTDIIQMREGLLQIRTLLINAISAIAEFAIKYKDIPTLAYTHFQAAQPTTVGKRATLWIQDFMFDLERLDFELSHLKLLGCKGTTGTGASFLALFDGDIEKVKILEKKIAEKVGFKDCIAVSGQTYTRKVDSFILNVLSGIAQSASKFATDLRLLAHLKEFDEPFETGQVGSSAMAYKRNPMRCERIVSLARYVITNSQNPAFTAANQWLERTLDDSANRRICIPEAFLATDSILSLVINIIRGGRIYPKVMEKHIAEEMPFIASENILMHAVSCGGDRQALHEAIRRYSVEAAQRVKIYGEDNNLLENLLNDPQFSLDKETLKEILDIKKFIGCAPSQTEEFIENYVNPLLEKNKNLLGLSVEVRV